MTAILTKQNVRDGALIGGGGGSKNGEFDTLHADSATFGQMYVKGDATIDGDCKVLMDNANMKNLKKALDYL